MLHFLLSGRVHGSAAAFTHAEVNVYVGARRHDDGPFSERSSDPSGR